MFNYKQIFAMILLSYIGIVNAAFGNVHDDQRGNFYQERPIQAMHYKNGLNGSDIYRIDVANLGYKAITGHFGTAYDLYVTAYYKNGQPQIIGYIQGGYEPKLSVKDLNSDGVKEVLLRYKVGAHTAGCKIYEITYDGADEIATVDDDQIMSNLDSINLIFNSQKKRFEFEIKNTKDLPLSEAPPPSSKYELVIERLALINGHISVVSKKSEIKDRTN